MAAPSFAPNTVNQTVVSDGETYKGQPGGGWVLQSLTQEYADQKGREVQQQFKDAVQPAVNSLEASRPEVKAAFDARSAQVEAGRTPLMERYQKLIDDIKGNTASQVTDTTRVTAQEFGRRGIPLSSTSAQEEQLRRTQPIEQAGQSNITNTTLDREEKLRGLDDIITNLTLENVASQRDITNTIAQIQASSGTQAAQAALEQWKVAQQQRENALDRAIAEKNAETARITANAGASQVGTQIVTQAGRQLLINSQTGETIRDIGPAGTGSGSGGINITGSTPSTISSAAKTQNATSSFKADVKDQYGNDLAKTLAVLDVGNSSKLQDQLKQAQVLKNLSGVKLGSTSSGGLLNLAGAPTYTNFK